MWRATEEAIVCVPAPHTPDIKNVILSCYCVCSDTLITTFMGFHKRDSHGGRLHSCLATIGSVCLCFWSIQTYAYKMRPAVTKLSIHPHCQRPLALKAHKRFFTNHICLPFLQTILSLCNKLSFAGSLCAPEHAIFLISAHLLKISLTFHLHDHIIIIFIIMCFRQRSIGLNVQSVGFPSGVRADVLVGTLHGSYHQQCMYELL